MVHHDSIPGSPWYGSGGEALCGPFLSGKGSLISLSVLILIPVGFKSLSDEWNHLSEITSPLSGNEGFTSS